MKKSTISEIKQLPFTLGKLAGGVMAVIGFPGMLFRINMNPDATAADLVPLLALGILGVFVFTLFSRLLTKQMQANADSAPTSKEKRKSTFLSWMIFLLICVLFVTITFIMAR